MRLGGNVLDAFGKSMSSLIKEKATHKGGPLSPTHFLLLGMLKFETVILGAVATCLEP